MDPIRRNLEQVWGQLRGQKASRPNSLEEVSIKGLRGIRELRIPLPFPVSVLVGPNGSGKSTVLFALACAYKAPEPEDRRLTPASLFPDFRPRPKEGLETYADMRPEVELTFSYVHNNERLQMKWARGREKWYRSFFGRKKARPPTREVYLRTLANLSNPSEVRSILQMSRQDFSQEAVAASNIAFAQRILSFRYASLRQCSKGLKSILFAERSTDDASPGARYSEFHMSAGERAVLRLSITLSKLQDALVLIDEIEAGLHPHVQMLLMLELHRLALRNRLQVVVTSHSPVALDSVPQEGRVFLERREDNVVRREAYRDIIQKALYGRSQNVLSLLCEDEEAEAFIRGVLDVKGPELDLLQNDVEVGRDAGKDQFVAHLETLGRFRKLPDFVFVLDGDGRELGPRLAARAAAMGQAAKVLFLPGTEAPEVWTWRTIRSQPERHAPVLGLSPAMLETRLAELETLFSGAADTRSNIAKSMLEALALECRMSTPDLVRRIAKRETESGAGEVSVFADELVEAIQDWRSGLG